MKLNAKVKGKINLKNNAMIKQIAVQSLVETADAVKGAKLCHLILENCKIEVHL